MSENKNQEEGDTSEPHDNPSGSSPRPDASDPFQIQQPTDTSVQQDQPPLGIPAVEQQLLDFQIQSPQQPGDSPAQQDQSPLDLSDPEQQLLDFQIQSAQRDQSPLDLSAPEQQLRDLQIQSAQQPGDPPAQQDQYPLDIAALEQQLLDLRTPSPQQPADSSVQPSQGPPFLIFDRDQPASDSWAQQDPALLNPPGQQG